MTNPMLNQPKHPALLAVAEALLANPLPVFGLMARIIRALTRIIYG